MKRGTLLLVLALASKAALGLGMGWQAQHQERLDRAMLQAARRGDRPAVVAWMRQGADPRAQDRRGRTAGDLLLLGELPRIAGPERGAGATAASRPSR